MFDENDSSPELRDRLEGFREGPGWPYVRPAESCEVIVPVALATPRAEMPPELIDELTTAVD